MVLKYLFTAVLTITTFIVFGQTNKEIAFQKGQEAIKLMDNGQVEESIALLEEAIKLDPDNTDYPYEMGYANYLKKNYQKTIDILSKLVKRKDATDLMYQLLGNSYDLIGKPDKAIDTYQSGLKKIPKSGKLYLELGNMYLQAEDFNQAIAYYEQGINAEPGYPSNYYRAAKLFLNSDNEVWGMIYGEIFMNLERNSGRTSEMSKLLYDTYKSQITFTSDTSFTVSFSSNNIVVDPKKIELPFGMLIYESTLLMEIIGEKSIDINSLDRIRTGFVKNYFINNRDKKYPNVLFDYQNRILQEGHMEAYNHWILMKGDEDAFTTWRKANNEKWEAFVDWFNPNGIAITDKNKFLRTNY